MKSDFGIEVGNKGKISSQVEGLGILHGIDKNEIYDFIRQINPLEFSDDEFGYNKKAMGEVEVNNDAFISSIIERAPRYMGLKAPSKIDERHVVPIKKYIWSIVRKLTHNEILYFGYRILESNPTALYAIRVKFPFICVDEFQDTNPLQTLLIKLIGQKSTVIGVVGDVAQSIYSFQGAQPTDFKNFNNSYYNSPIQLRDEIAEHNNVTWVRAFRFIFNLWESYLNGSFIDVIHALKLYATINVRNLSPKAIFQIKKLSGNVFGEVDEQSHTCEIIKKFNTEIAKPDFTILRETFLECDFTILLFDDLDDAKLTTAVAGLSWGTSYKLFTEVFSKNSKYMTVHQAKGLEWDKVIVSITPNKFDKINIADLYSNPQLMNENPADEFTRMYYVACSRAKEDLYVHILDESLISKLQVSINAYIEKTGKSIANEFIQ